jgi:signal transduction histidine kinase/DNA-binding response OmpR family regulator/ligand-binding sensor domain-containing protein
MAARFHRTADGCRIVFHTEANRRTNRGYHFHRQLQNTYQKELEQVGCDCVFRSSGLLHRILYLFLVEQKEVDFGIAVCVSVISDIICNFVPNNLNAMRPIYLLIIAVILSSVAVYPANEKFCSVNALYGTSMREMTSVCKDKDGFIWASSHTGVLRLTEDDYRIYALPYETTNVLFVKLAYNHSQLLAYTNNGQLFRYNPLYDRFDFLLNLSKLLNNRHLFVQNALIDDDGSFWIATSTGCYTFNEGKLSLLWDDVEEVYAVVKCDSEHIFIANTKGIWLIDTHSMQRENVCANNPTTSIIYSTLFYDDTVGKLWVGSRSSGLFSYDLKTKTFAAVLPGIIPKQPIMAIDAISESAIWVGIDGQGIWEVDKAGRQIGNVHKEDIDNPASLQGNGVYDIMYDGNKRIWICTITGGVSFIDRKTPLVNQVMHQLNVSNSLTNNNVNAMIEDKKGNIWFATDNGISCWNVSANQWRTFYHNKQGQANVFLALCEDDRGRIWAGTYSSGVFVLDGASGRETAHYVAGKQGATISSNFIFDIFKDKSGNLWFGGNQGDVVCYITNENRFRTYSFLPVAAITELSSEYMLFACSYGVCSLDKQSGEIKLLIEDYPVSDFVATEKNIWACTSGEGLVCYDRHNKTIEKYTTQSGLPSNYVNSILSLGDYLWLGTESGLCRFNPKDKTVSTYASLLNLSKVAYNRHAKYKLKSGQLIWGTNQGAIFFYPDSIVQIQPRGRIFFQDLSLSGRSVRDSSGYLLTTPVNEIEEISLKYNQNTLSMELLPIDISDAGSQFSWKMEGLDDDWRLPSHRRIISYSNLPNGHFQLKIRLYDSSLSHIVAERELKIHITPPFWETGWFRLLIFAIVTGIVWFSLRFYINRLKQLHSEEKVRFFTNTAHDIRTSLTLIKGPVEELVKESNLSELGRRYLQLITEQSRRLSVVITQLMDFQKVDVGKGQLALTMVDIVKLVAHRTLMFESYAKANKIELFFSPEKPAYLTAIDELKIEKAIDNLISNAIKYSYPDSRVDIVLKCNADNWTLEITDNGIGIGSQAQRKLFKEFYRSENAVNSKIIGSGVGLMLVKHYIVMHGGDISFVSKENEGTIFKVIIPFKEIIDEKKPAAPTHTSEVFTSLPCSQISLPLRQTNIQQHGMRLLIVEDNPDMQNFISSVLCEEFQVSTACDGLQGWEVIQKQQPDLVISDVMMPNMDGFELCRRMKSTYETSHIPIILLTSLSEKTQQLQGLGLGADDYLTKPFDMTLLSQRIKSILRNRKVIRDKALKLIKENENEPLLANELNDKFIKKALEVVRRNMNNSEFGKDEFASAMNVSSSLLYKKIKSLTDQPPIDFIKSIRLNNALELLRTKKYNITEVGDICGFTSISYFSQAFKKYFGKTPSEVLDDSGNA